jgi:hypothetical protein
MLEVDHCWHGAGLPHVVRVVGVADQGDDFVATLGQEPGEAQSDLAVASGDGYSHGLKPKPARDAAAAGLANAGKPRSRMVTGHRTRHSES